MCTLRQLSTKRSRRTPIKKKNKVPSLKSCPQKLGAVQRVYIETPKKPNSAKRVCIKVKLSTGRIVSCHIPGIGHTLGKHSKVLIRGGKTQDLVGVKYKPIRGKYDLKPVEGRISRKSKYGLKTK